MPFAGDTLFPGSIPLADWALLEEEQHAYLERKSGLLVECRFLKYAQKIPRVIAPDDCKLLKALAESP